MASYSLLGEAGFDRYVESLCAPHYHDSMGRPGAATAAGIPPGVYFRMLLIGYPRWPRHFHSCAVTLVMLYRFAHTLKESVEALISARMAASCGLANELCSSHGVPSGLSASVRPRILSLAKNNGQLRTGILPYGT